MSKHTKAPWVWQKFGNDYHLTAQHGDREIIIGARVNKETGIPYPAMNDNEQFGTLRPIFPSHPNAKLIAAAPDLLEALQAMDELDKLEHLSKAWWKQAEKCNELREKALQKATT